MLPLLYACVSLITLFSTARLRRGVSMISARLLIRQFNASDIFVNKKSISRNDCGRKTRRRSTYIEQKTTTIAIERTAGPLPGSLTRTVSGPQLCCYFFAPIFFLRLRLDIGLFSKVEGCSCRHAFTRGVTRRAPRYSTTHAFTFNYTYSKFFRAN